MAEAREALILRALDRRDAPRTLMRRAGHALLTAAIVCAVLVFPALVLFIIYPPAAAAYVGLPALVWAAHNLSLRYHARARRLALDRALADHLARRGVALEDTSARAQQVRAAFWRDAQLSALVELRYRQLPDDAPLLAALPTVWRAQRDVLMILGLGWGAISGVIALIATLGSQGSASAGIFCCVFSAMLYGAVVSYWLGAGLLSDALRTANQRRELEREVRHVAQIMDAAGGLSLAEDEVASTLRGALSGDVAQGGELEEVH